MATLTISFALWEVLLMANLSRKSQARREKKVGGVCSIDSFIVEAARVSTASLT